MVTFENCGRMGNFLFQAAATMAYAWQHGLDFTVPSTTRSAKDNPVYLPHLVNPKWDPKLMLRKAQEQGHGYQRIPFHEEWRSGNIVLDGYWQSEKYFKDYRDLVIEKLGFAWHLEPQVSVHVRRGDYLTIRRAGLFKHPTVTQQWYETAMAKFPGMQFKFFSDDIPWCQQMFGNRKDCGFASGSNEVQDLVEGSWCEHNICSASTFSWWQAWLNRNPLKRVVIPTHWLTPGWANLYMGDIVPETWERLSWFQ